MSIDVDGLSQVHLDQTILHPTCVTIDAGEKVGLVGLSGSGKSTLGYLLIDALRAQKRPITYVPQSPDEALDPLRSLAYHWREAELALGLAAGSADQQAIFSALKLNTDNLPQRPWQWSRGMQQRFVIAMALIGLPELIVLDEPTSALDPVVAAETINLLEQHLHGTQTAMLLITHNLGLVASRVTRLMVMHAGRIVEQAATNTILHNPTSAPAKALVAHKNWLSLPC